LKNIFIKTKQILESHRGPLHFGLGMWLGMWTIMALSKEGEHFHSEKKV
jgi:hypothetical protein